MSMQTNIKTTIELKRALIQQGVSSKELQGLDAEALQALLDVKERLNETETTETLETITGTGTMKVEDKPKRKAKKSTAALEGDLAQAAQLLELMKAMQPASETINEERIIELIQKHATQNITVDIKKGDKEIATIEGAHDALPEVLEWLATGNHVYLVGPAGSGKTYLAEQAAEALGLDFYTTGAVLQKYEITGFMDANSNYILTAAYSAFVNGGVFLLDEMDSSAAAALVAFNAMLSNDYYTFPNCDKPVKRHPDFIVIAAANTIGTGPTRQYVGRQPLDLSTLDRFIVQEVSYNEQLEQRLALREFTANGGTDNNIAINWVKEVQTLRANCSAAKLQVIISPRRSMQGAAMLGRGTLDIKKVRKATIHAMLTSDQIKKYAV